MRQILAEMELQILWKKDEEKEVPTPTRSILATFLIKSDIKVKFQSPQCGASKQRARVRGDGTNLAEALGGARERHFSHSRWS